MHKILIWQINLIHRHPCYCLHYESDAQEIERSLLERGGLSDLVELSGLLIGPLHLHCVSGDGGQIGEQGLKTVNEEAIIGDLGCRLPLGRLGTLSRDHHVGTAFGCIGRVVIVEEDRGQDFAHVPFDIVGQHAQEDMSLHAIGQAMVDGADFEIDALQAPERPLHLAQALVGAHGLVGREDLFGHTGSDHVDAVESRLLGDGSEVSLVDEALLLDGDHEMLGHLELADDFAHPQTDFLLALEAPFGTRCGEFDFVELSFGPLEKGLAGLCPIVGQRGVAADDETLARVVRVGDLRHVALVENAELGCPALQELADLRRAQSRDPVESFLLPETVFEPDLGDYPPVAHEHDPLDAKALLDLLHLAFNGSRVGRVALEDLNRQGTPVRSTQQSDHDLRFVGFAVPTVAELREGACPALEVGRGDVVEHEGPAMEVPGSQGVFDPFLLTRKPVHGEVELVFADRPKSKDLAQTARSRLGVETSRSGELRLGLDDSGDDHGQYEGEHSALFRGDDVIEAALDECSQNCGHVAVRKGAQHLDRFFEILDGVPAAK